MSIQGNWDRRISRKKFLTAGGLGAAALALGSTEALGKPGRGNSGGGSAGFGLLKEDEAGILDLPRGFQYRIVSEQGTNLSSGKPVPGDHDGMAAFQGPGNTTTLVRNHELSPSDLAGDDAPVVGENPYDPAQPGGTTGIVIGPNRKEVKDYVTSSGTNRNCSGGPTPWGTWITCEETRIRAAGGSANKAHGYCFEVLPDGSQTLSDKPIKGMGFFSHEAIGVDPRTGIAYLTEDDFRQPIPDDPDSETEAGSRSSFLYRFIPNARNLGPGAYLKGGRLQALSIEEMPNYNADLARQGQRFGVVWRDVDPEFAHTDALAKDCARFNRLEGADFSGGAFWFDDTAGGEERLGQRSGATSRPPRRWSSFLRVRTPTTCRARTTSSSPRSATCGSAKTVAVPTASWASCWTVKSTSSPATASTTPNSPVAPLSLKEKPFCQHSEPRPHVRHLGSVWPGQPGPPAPDGLLIPSGKPRSTSLASSPKSPRRTA